MKTIGVITFHSSSNYGAVLQCYALQRTLQGLGYDSEVIDYFNPNRKTSLLSPFRRARHFLWHRFAKRILVGMDRERKTAEFRSTHIRLSPVKYADLQSLYRNPPIYDAYITGSDQVWNPSIHGNDPTYFLTFAPSSGRRISYAASFGVSRLPSQVREDFRRWLDQIDYLSVREIEGNRIVEELTGRSPQIALDPTLLLAKDQWRQIAVPFSESRPYILCYYMPGDKVVCRGITELAHRLSVLKGWRIVSIGDKEYTRLLPWRQSVFDAGPAEFLGLFQNASFVVTNSFHGTAFSITYEKPFLVPINESLPPERSLSSRINSLLSMLGLESRILTERDGRLGDGIFDIDFTKVGVALQQARRRSLDFLVTALEDMN